MSDLNLLRDLEFKELLKILSGLNETANHEKNDNRLVLFGGIHGAGKSSLCKDIKSIFNGIRIESAAELLKWADNDKRVNDIDTNQIILTSEINELKEKNHLTLLDCHFCVFDSDGVFSFVGERIFKDIAPCMILLAEASPEVIQDRLINRDNRRYSISLLKEMLKKERYFAQKTASSLNIPIYRLKSVKN